MQRHDSSNEGHETQAGEALSQRQEYVDQVLSYVEAIRGRKLAGQLEFDNIIGISGQRGVGKSTLLRHTCQALEGRGGDIVLEPITPQDLGMSLSIGSVVLIGLRQDVDALRELIESEGDKERRDRVRELENTLLEVTLGLARSLRSSVRQEVSSGDEYRWQVTRAEESTYVSKRLFHEWLHEYFVFRSEVLGIRDDNSLLVVALDDFDLDPELLPSAIGELGRFLLSERIVIILAFTDEAMFRAIAQKLLDPLHETFEALERTGYLTQESMVREIDDYVSKVVPSATRVFLPSWSQPLEKLLYCPPGSDKPLVELLDSVKLGPEGPWRSLAQIFDLSDWLSLGKKTPGHVPSHFCEILPDSARGLRSLYDVLWPFASLPNPGAIADSELFNLLDRLVRVSSLMMSHRDRSELQDVIEFLPSGRISLDFRSLRFLKSYSGGTGFRTTRTEGTRRLLAEDVPQLRMREGLSSRDDIEGIVPAITEPLMAETRVVRIGDFASFRIVPETDNGTRSASTRAAQDGTPPGLRRVQYGRLLELVHEITKISKGIFDGHWGEIRYWGTVDWSGTVTITVSDQESDDLFFMIPDWNWYFPYFLYATAWNEMVDRTRGIEFDVDDPHQGARLAEIGSATKDLLFAQHLQLILSVETGTRFDVGDPIGPRPTPDLLRAATHRRQEETIELLQRYIAQGVPNHFFDSRIAFVADFAVCALYGTTRVLLSDDAIAWVRENLLPPALDLLRGFEGTDWVWEMLWRRVRWNPESIATAFVLADHLESMAILDPEYFRANAQDLHARWTEALRNRIGGQYELAEQLRARGILTNEESDTLLSEGPTPVILAKLSTVDPSLRELVLGVFGAESTGSDTSEKSRGPR